MILWSNFKQYLAVTFSVSFLIAPLNNHWRYFLQYCAHHTHTHTHTQTTHNTHTQHTHTHTLSLSLSLFLSLSLSHTYTHTHTILNQINSWAAGLCDGKQNSSGVCECVCTDPRDPRIVEMCCLEPFFTQETLVQKKKRVCVLENRCALENTD